MARVIGELSVWSLLAATLLAMAGIWFSFLSWRALLADFGSAVPLTGAMRIFFVGQLGKYVPGKVWPILAQVRLGRAHRVPGRSSAAAAAIVTLITLGAGLLVTAITLPVLGADALSRYWWTLLALPLALLVLWPPVLNGLLARLMRLARREPMPQPLTGAGVARAVGWALVMWICYGVHLWILLGASQSLTPGLLVRSVGAFAGSWAIGFLLLLAPAGLGPREVALVVLLGGAVAQPVALVAALISRLLLTIADTRSACVSPPGIPPPIRPTRSDQLPRSQVDSTGRRARATRPGPWPGRARCRATNGATPARMRVLITFVRGWNSRPEVWVRSPAVGAAPSMRRAASRSRTASSTYPSGQP